MQLIDGKATANAIKEQIAEEVAQIVANGGKQPHLAAVLVGHEEAARPMSRIRCLPVRSVDSSRPLFVTRTT